ncbi:MAG TPA: EthD family reductase [Chloroflexota bacterium]|nr:EthD family reductase [Chloroflexota bacterium]
MIKIIAGANRHPNSRSLAEFHHYWSHLHGPMFAKTPHLLRYVQHLTLPEAYGSNPAPTHDGVSFFWYESLDALRNASPSPRLADVIGPEDGDVYDWYVRSARYGDPNVITLAHNVRADDAQLFDRLPEWPIGHKRMSVIAAERVVLDGPTTPSMVKAVIVASRLPGLTLREFQDHWITVHGPLGAKVPGLRRYVQNHALQEAYAFRDLTHDGFAELWFDDLAALQRAVQTPEWKALQEDGRTLFAQPMATVIAREGVIKG